MFETAERTSILLVEDDQVDVMNVKRAFRKNNIKTPLYVAWDGIEALEMLRGPRSSELEIFPKIVLLDINMPRMNGIELLREIRGDDKLSKLLVFVLTTSSNDEDIINAYSLNVAGYILKPVTFDKFVEAVSTLSKFWNINELP